MQQETLSKITTKELISNQKYDSSKDIRKPESTVQKSRSIFYVDMYDLDVTGHPAKWKIYYAKLMVVFAVLSQVFLLLQVIEIFQTKTASGVSIPAYFVYELSNLLWGYYATKILLYVNYPILLSCIVSFVLAGIIIAGAFIYQ